MENDRPNPYLGKPDMTEKDKKFYALSAWKRTILEWLGIAMVAGLLYITGLHTEVIGAMQRVVLWTGLFDAEHSVVQVAEGPFLGADGYRFAMTDRHGERISLAEMRGKVLFVNVWATWCPPCIAEMPTIQALYDKVGGREQIRFVMLSQDQDHHKARQFMRNKNFTVPYYFPASRLPAALQSSYIPATYVISKEGQVVYRREGIADYSSEDFRDWLIELAE